MYRVEKSEKSLYPAGRNERRITHDKKLANRVTERSTMFKYSFQNDYSEGAHPRILEALTKTNLRQEVGYSEDEICNSARKKILAAIGNPDADVHFVSGGTQANLLVLSCFMKPWESVIAVESGHICVHETGAVEATAPAIQCHV